MPVVTRKSDERHARPDQSGNRAIILPPFVRSERPGHPGSDIPGFPNSHRECAYRFHRPVLQLS